MLNMLTDAQKTTVYYPQYNLFNTSNLGDYKYFKTDF